MTVTSLLSWVERFALNDIPVLTHMLGILSPCSEEVMLAEEDKNAEEKSPLDGAWYKRKCNNPGWN